MAGRECEMTSSEEMSGSGEQESERLSLHRQMIRVSELHNLCRTSRRNRGARMQELMQQEEVSGGIDDGNEAIRQVGTCADSNHSC